MGALAGACLLPPSSRQTGLTSCLLTRRGGTKPCELGAIIIILVHLIVYHTTWRQFFSASQRYGAREAWWLQRYRGNMVVAKGCEGLRRVAPHAGSPEQNKDAWMLKVSLRLEALIPTVTLSNDRSNSSSHSVLGRLTCRSIVSMSKQRG